MVEIALRPDQQGAADGVDAGIARQHLKQILMAPCGAGKTVMGAYFLRRLHRQNKRAVFLVDRIPLVGQTSETLRHYGVPHGVLQAENTRRTYEPILVASAQTIERRGLDPDMDWLIVDEAHAMRRATLDLIAARPDLVVLGLTATPFSRGMARYYSNLVSVCTTDQLIAQGILVPLTMYAATPIDMRGARIVAGEWSEADLTARGLQIVGDIVREWCAKTALHFGGPVKTIVFAASVAHGAELCRQFNAAGYNFQQISYRMDTVTREALISEFRKPDSRIHGLVSCEVFQRGFDVPDVQCVITARPYRKNFSGHIQQLGRGMRSAAGKTFCLLLDHCGNLLRFMKDMLALFAHGLQRLDARAELDRAAREEPGVDAPFEAVCACGYVMFSAVPVCPMCGATRKTRAALVEALPGVMRAVRPSDAPVVKDAYLADRLAVWRQLTQYALEQKKGEVVSAKKLALALYHDLYQGFPGAAFSTQNVQRPTQALLGKLTSLRIAHARRRAKEAA